MAIKCKGFNIFLTDSENMVPINNWLKENPNIKIIDTNQTQDDNYLYITIFYQE